MISPSPHSNTLPVRQEGERKPSPQFRTFPTPLISTKDGGGRSSSFHGALHVDSMGVMGCPPVVTLTEHHGRTRQAFTTHWATRGELRQCLMLTAVYATHHAAPAKSSIARAKGTPSPKLRHEGLNAWLGCWVTSTATGGRTGTGPTAQGYLPDQHTCYPLSPAKNDGPVLRPTVGQSTLAPQAMQQISLLN